MPRKATHALGQTKITQNANERSQEKESCAMLTVLFYSSSLLISNFLFSRIVFDFSESFILVSISVIIVNSHSRILGCAKFVVRIFIEVSIKTTKLSWCIVVSRCVPLLFVLAVPA